MLRLLYTLLFYLIQPFVWVKLLLRSRKSPGYRQRILERYGFCKGKVLPDGILIHSVSVGETVAAIPLIRSLQQQYPDLPMTVTTMTVTGSDLVKKTFGDSVSHVYLPYDLPCAIRRFLKTLRPQLVVIMETELWPNLINALYHRHIPLILANARLSERSAARYQKLGKSITRLLNQISKIAVQNEADGERFLHLGLLPTKLTVTGSIKFDVALTEEQHNNIDELKQKWQLDRLVWIAASTHAGEDEVILESHSQLLTDYPSLLLILVPRHPERFSDVEQLIQARSLQYVTRSSNNVPDENTQVILGDTMGELITLYGLSDFAFIGGSLIERGGHNPLEAALHHLPIMMGKHIFNFEPICQMLAKNQGLKWVENSENLVNQLKEWIDDPKRAQSIGENSYLILKQNQGALSKLESLIHSILENNQQELK